MPLDTQNTGTASIADRAVLVQLKVSIWTATKRDDEASDTVNSSTGASAEAGDYRKRLLSRDAFKVLRTIEREARAYHNEVSSPWMAEGVRILPAPAFEKYRQTMLGFKTQFDSAIGTAVADYPSHIDAAKAFLGSLFEETEYPDQSAIEEKFGFEMKLIPFPDHMDFRIQLSDEIREEMQVEMAEQAEKANRALVKDAQSRLMKSVSHFADKLRDYEPGKSKLYDSTLTSIGRTVEVVKMLNITDDPDINAAIAEIEEGILSKKYTKDELKTDDIVREEAAGAAASIVENMQGMF